MSNVFENKGATATTIVVAASDSLNKGAANYVASGAADEVEIQAAIDALPVDGGGILLLEGTYNISSAIDISGHSDVVFTGVGSSTLINNQNIAGADAISCVNDAGSPKDRVQIKNLRILGNAASGNGINVKHVNYLHIEGVYSESNGTNGLRFEWDDHAGENQMIHYSQFLYNGATGALIIRVHDLLISHCHSEGNTTNGFRILQSFDPTLVCCSIEDNILQQIYLSDNRSVSIVGCVIEGAGNEYDGIYSEAINRATISSNRFESLKRGIYILANANIELVAITGNSFAGISSSAITITRSAANKLSTVSIVGNVMGYDGFADGAATVSINYCANVVFEANSLRVHGTCIFKEIDNLIIEGNIFQGKPLANGTTAIISLRDAINSAIIRDNILSKISGEADYDYGIEFITPTITNMEIKGNQISGATTPIFAAPNNVLRYDNYSDLSIDVLASSANLIVNAQNLANGAVALTGTQPKYPRGLDCTITEVAGNVSAYTMTVVGTNAKGETITEVFTFADDGLTFSSDNAFDHVTSVTLADVIDTGNATFVMGIDERLGLMNPIYETSDVWKITKNLAKQVVAIAQVNTDYNTYDMSVIGLALNDDFVIWYRSNLNIIS